MMETSENKTARVFVALPLDASVINMLHQLQQQLKRLVPGELVRWVRPEQIHITLRFYGNVPGSQLEALIAALRPLSQRMSSLSLHLDKIGCFPDLRSPRVLWVGLGGELDRLNQLQADIQNATASYGDHQETKAFSPHLTLGRIKDFRSKHARGLGEIVSRWEGEISGSWTARHLELLQSHLSPQGSQYQSLANIPLLPQTGLSGLV